MKRIALFCSVWLLLGCLTGVFAAPQLPLVPTPASMELSSGKPFELNARSRIFFQTRKAPRAIEATLEPMAKVLAGELELVTGLRPKITKWAARPKPGDVLLRFQEVKGDFAKTEPEEDQSYVLNVSPRGIVVESAYYKGLC